MLDPEALSEALRLLLEPTTTLPKLKALGEIASWPGTAPKPANETVKFGLEALETTEMLPPADPAEVGAKATPKVKLCPGDRVMGRFSPVTLKPLPVTLACVTVTLAPPVLVKVSGWVVLPPTCTLPKLMEDAAANVPGVVPLPEIGSASVELEALLVIETRPLTLPAAWGANVTLKFLLWPAVRVTGGLIPLRVKPAPPVMFAWLIVTLEPPELVRVPVTV